MLFNQFKVFTSVKRENIIKGHKQKTKMLKIKSQKSFKRYLRSTPVLITVSVLIMFMVFTHGFGILAASCSSVTDCQQQINNLNNANNSVNQQISNLEAQAGSYQASISALQAQVSNLQSQIYSNEVQQTNVQNQINSDQQEILNQKSILSNDIKTLYESGQITPIEMLATSSSISQYVDQQEAYTAVQNKIQSTLTEITSLEQQLQIQKNQLGLLLKSLNNQEAQVAQEQAAENNLLAMNQSQQSTFNQQIQTNKSALNQLYAQQAAIIASSFGGGYHYGGTGGYPYSNASCLNYNGNCGPYGGAPFGPYAWGYPPNDQYDPSGWAYRNCTSYAFWKLYQTTGIDLTAYNFPDVASGGQAIKYSVIDYSGALNGDFEHMGYAVNKDPNGKAVLAVQTEGPYGHIMYVEGVVNGNAVVSQYNASENGLYSTGTLTNLSGIYFIHIE